MAQRKRQRVSESEAALVTEHSDAGSASARNLDHQEELDHSPRRKRPLHSRSIFVHSLPVSTTTEKLTAYFSQSYPIKHALAVVDAVTRLSKGYGFVTFADAEDAQKAKIHFDRSVFEGRKIRVEVAEPRHRSEAIDGIEGGRKSQPSATALLAKAEREKQRQQNRQPPKLIIRNLPWSIKEPDQLASLFQSYGKIKQVTLPKQKLGLSPGFGFVTLRGRQNAEKALIAVNGQVVDGRTLAVDWAVDKNVWHTLHNRGGDDEHNDLLAVDGEHHDSDCKSDDASTVKTENDGTSTRLEDISLSKIEHDQISSDNEDDNSVVDDSKEKALKDWSKDQPSTLFIRNLPFNSTDETFEEHFCKFGPVRYARVVIDHASGRPKGTGFVCFYNVDDADQCLRGAPRSQIASAPQPGGKKRPHSLLEDTGADYTGRYTLDGRVLQVSRAVGREQAERFTIENSSNRIALDRDKRRLYLLSEGTIPSNSPLYHRLAPSEAKLRESSAKQRQALMKSNPSLKLSLIRLSIRNIPRGITSKDLKALAREAVVGFAKDVKSGTRKSLSKEELCRGLEEMREVEKARKIKGKGIVNQAKIVFEGREGGKVAEHSGAGRSRGYGFIEYVSHRWALMGLRWLNGHAVAEPPGDTPSSSMPAGKSKRLIVEFAIENAQVVQRRQDREVKARERSTAARSVSAAQLPTPSKPAGKNVLISKARSTSRAPDAVSRRSRLRKSELQSPSSSKAETIAAKDHGDRSNKELKRQQIIGKKRMMRKARTKAAS